MTYWNSKSDGSERFGYNKDEKNGEIAKISRLSNISGDNHDREFLDLQTGVFGYHGDNSDKKQYGKDYQEFSDNYGYTRKKSR